MKPHLSKDSTSPIFIPNNSYLEGYLKSHKSVRIECNFKGTILTQKKVIIESSSVVIGDIICEELLLSGIVKVNIFCTGRVEMNPDSSIQDKVYTSMFTNLSDTNSDFIVQIPKRSVLNEVRKHLEGLKTDIGLSKDELLTTIRDCFYENVYARRKNPDEKIKSEFTAQLKILKRKIDEAPKVSKTVVESIKKHQ